MDTNAIPVLRPLGMGQLLDQAIRLYRQNFLKFIAIIGVVQIPITLLQMGAALLMTSSVSYDYASPMPGPGYFLGMGGSCLVSIASLILLQGMATAALTRAVADQYLGRQTGFVDAYRRIGSAWRSLVGALLLASLISILLALWTLIPCIGWLTGIGILAFYAMVIVPFVAPIVVLERTSAYDAIRRAWDLARRRFWWVLGFAALLSLFSLIVVSGPAALFNYALQFVVGPSLPMSASSALTLQTVLQSLVSLILGLLYTPLQLTSMTLLYFDLRVRTEGLDMSLMAQASADTAADPSRLIAWAPTPERGGLVNWTEMGYFALVSIGAGVLFGALYAVIVATGMSMFMLGSTPGF